jgi:small-conductance mechanosensitive channel
MFGVWQGNPINLTLNTFMKGEAFWELLQKYLEIAHLDVLCQGLQHCPRQIGRLMSTLSNTIFKTAMVSWSLQFFSARLVGAPYCTLACFWPGWAPSITAGWKTATHWSIPVPSLLSLIRVWNAWAAPQTSSMERME